MVIPSRDILILAIGQALTSTVVSLLTSVSSLSGAYLAPQPALSTVPVTATIVGALVMIYPASTLMGHFGRKLGFMLKAGIGILGGVTAMIAMVWHSFPLLILGTFLLGIFSAFGQYYRFAAIDAAKAPDEYASAVAVVTGAGVVGGIAGPYLGGHFADTVINAPYAGAFMVLALVCVALTCSQLFLSSQLGRHNQPASLNEQHSQKLGKGFLKASFICAIGFAVMTLIMNAAPLSIHQHGYNIHDSSMVLQLHFALMYLPSFFNPILVRYIEVRGLVLLGIIAGALGCFLSITTNQNFLMYMIELGLAGISWNFMFNGGTLLLTKTYPPSAKARAQGLNSTFVYCANVIASLSAGVLMATSGWATLNLFSIPLLLLAIWSLRALR